MKIYSWLVKAQTGVRPCSLVSIDMKILRGEHVERVLGGGLEVGNSSQGGCGRGLCGKFR